VFAREFCCHTAYQKSRSHTDTHRHAQNTYTYTHKTNTRASQTQTTFFGALRAQKKPTESCLLSCPSLRRRQKSRKKLRPHCKSGYGRDSLVSHMFDREDQFVSPTDDICSIHSHRITLCTGCHIHTLTHKYTHRCTLKHTHIHTHTNEQTRTACAHHMGLLSASRWVPRTHSWRQHDTKSACWQRSYTNLQHMHLTSEGGVLWQITP
jgi:hypothetical protein